MLAIAPNGLRSVSCWALFGTVRGLEDSGTSSNNGDAQLVNSAYHFSASRVPQLQVRMRASQNTGVQLFFATGTQPGFSATRVASANYTGNGAWQTLTFDMTGQVDWAGTITDLRLDPVSGVGIQFDIEWPQLQRTRHRDFPGWMGLGKSGIFKRWNLWLVGIDSR